MTTRRMHQALDTGGRLGRYYSILQATGDMHGTGVGIAPSPRPAQSLVQQRIQTPSRAEHGPGGRFNFQSRIFPLHPAFKATNSGYRCRVQEIFLSTRSACLVSLSSPKREFLSVISISPNGKMACAASPVFPDTRLTARCTMRMSGDLSC